MKTKIFISVYILILISPFFSCNKAQQQNDLHPELQNALLLVDETFNILDTTVPEVWPDWNRYKDEIYFTAVIDEQDLMINPPKHPEDDFELLDLKIHNKPVYLRDPGEEEKIWGGAHRFKIDGKRYKAVQFHPQSKEYSSKVIDYNKNSLGEKNISKNLLDYFYSTEYFIGIIIHEAFHRWQFGVNKPKVINAEHPSEFFLNEKYMQLLKLEGQILAQAFGNQNKDELIELSRQFLAVRKERRQDLTEKDIHWEKRNEYAEGGAQYVQEKVYLTLNSKGYTPKALNENDIGYESFRFGAALDTLLTLKINSVNLSKEDESTADNRCYFWGMAQGFILDKLNGNDWKHEYFDDDVYFETLIEKYCEYKNSEQNKYLKMALESFKDDGK